LVLAFFFGEVGDVGIVAVLTTCASPV